MTEATAATAANPGMDRYNRYYNTVLAQLQQDMGPERSDSQLKNYLMRLIRPSYDQAIAQRQQQTGQANAMIDTDAASRGMGTSTWVTDAKNRQRNNEATDIATLNSNYASTLYDALLNQIGQRDQLRMNLMNQAQGIAGNMYDRWKAEEDAANAGSGGGGGLTGDGGGGGSRRRSGGGNDLPGFGDDLLNGANDKTALTDLEKDAKAVGSTYTPVTNSNKNSTAYQGKAYDPTAFRPATPVAGTGPVGGTRNLNDDKINGKTGLTSPLGLKITKTRVR
jgi:hypothetical protein